MKDYNWIHAMKSLGSIRRGDPKPAFHCGQCGLEIEGREKVRAHMVEVHGFQQAGFQVFKRQICELCTRPALYRVGPHVYCRDHLAVGREEQRKAQARKAPGEDAEYDRHIEKDERRLQHESLRRTKVARK